MKKILKIIFSIIGVIFLFLMILGQISKLVMRPTIAKASQQYEFARMIERVNQDCPIPAAMGRGAVTSVKLENGYVTFYISYEPEFFNILSGLKNEEKVKEGLIMCFLCVNAQGNNNGDLIMDKLEFFNYGVKLIITESAKGRFEYCATADEIKNLRKKYNLNPHEALYNLLLLGLEAERATLPMDLGDGIVLQDCRLEDENITLRIHIDESLYSIDELLSNKEQVKESILEEGLRDPSCKGLLDMCKVSHSGLKYIYEGNRSKKTAEILLSSRELRDVVETPPMLNIQ